jgi:hypothetical protein
MDLPDFEAHADYWKRQAELHPDDVEVLDMRALAVAEYIVQIAALVYFNPDLEID